jgi:hypothetical protein
MSHRNIVIVNKFFSKAPALRKIFENNFSDPKVTHRKRFVWDYWNVPNQYRLVRTPADYYFADSKDYTALIDRLVLWGRENLGCHSVSQPWLSYYVDGCRQNFHSDVPHGPWAFVYSLSPKKIKYSGGETLILKPEVTNFWNQFSDQADYEFNSFFDVVKSPFNRLTVFDPRYPHGVSEVRGVEDPLEARLVLHGWFVEPRPYVVGPISTTVVQKKIEPGFQKLSSILNEFEAVNGTICFRLDISKSGEIKKYTLLTDTLMSPLASYQELSELRREIKLIFSSLLFKTEKQESKITIPLLFKA